MAAGRPLADELGAYRQGGPLLRSRAQGDRRRDEGGRGREFDDARRVLAGLRERHDREVPPDEFADPPSAMVPQIPSVTPSSSSTIRWRRSCGSRAPPRVNSAIRKTAPSSRSISEYESTPPGNRRNVMRMPSL
jgi:hypothetical protein